MRDAAWSFYAYVRNTPLTFTDPSGLVCGVYVWREQANYPTPPVAWGHEAIVFPGGLLDFIPDGQKPGWNKWVPGVARFIPGNFDRPFTNPDFVQDTEFADPKCPTGCNKALECLKGTASYMNAQQPGYCINKFNCQHFVDWALARCGLKRGALTPMGWEPNAVP